jgi:uncharacterized membrane protein
VAGLCLLATAGLGVSLYLLVTRLTDNTIVCGGLGQCDYVNRSDYATVLGLPVAAFGAALYAVLLVAAVAWLARPRSELLPVATWGVALAGASYSAYLTYVEVAVIDAVCVWCLVSASILAASFVLSTFAVLREPPRA